MWQSDYKKGLKEGVRLAKKMVNNDIRMLYGMGACVLKDQKGWTDEEVSQWIADVEQLWQSVVESGQSVDEYLQQHLAFDIEQIK